MKLTGEEKRQSPGVLGYLGKDVSGEKVVEVRGDSSKYYVRFPPGVFGEDWRTEPLPHENACPPIVDLPVEVGYSRDGRLTIRGYVVLGDSPAPPPAASDGVG